MQWALKRESLCFHLSMEVFRLCSSQVAEALITECHLLNKTSQRLVYFKLSRIGL